MKIGLVRHFKVNHPFPEKTFVTKSDVKQWFADYDSALEIEYKNVDLAGIQWKRCYSSTMIRAIKTAGHIYKGEIVEMAELKELDILHRLPDGLKLPFMVWGAMVRLLSFTSNKDTHDFKNRIISFIDNVLSNHEDDILIVSHWFVLRVIRKELMKRGLTGADFKSDDYGTLYVYERSKEKKG